MGSRLPMDHEDVLDEAAKRLYDIYLLGDGATPRGVKDYLAQPRVRGRFVLVFRRTVEQMLKDHTADLRALVRSLLACTHGDEATCGCRVAAVAALASYGTVKEGR